jgi:hypothetical protein
MLQHLLGMLRVLDKITIVPLTPAALTRPKHVPRNVVHLRRSLSLGDLCASFFVGPESLHHKSSPESIHFVYELI